MVTKGKLSPFSREIASIGRSTAKNLMALQTIEGYASLVENILRLPSEVAPPKAVSEIPPKSKEKWHWHLFENSNSAYVNRTLRSYRYLDKIEQQWNRSQQEGSGGTAAIDESFVYSIWEEEKYIEIAYTRKRREEEEVRCEVIATHT